MRPIIKLDHTGMAQVLKSAEVAAKVAALAEGVAAEVRNAEPVARNDVPVKVDRYVTDRAAASVTLAHPAGLPIEGKHGVLARAAGGKGLEVRGRQ